MGEGREYGFPKEDMRGAGVGKDGEGVMEHKRAGVEESSSTSSSLQSSDSNASKGLGWKKREVIGGRNYSRKERKSSIRGKGEVMLKVVNGLTRTVGREVGRLSSVPGGVWGGGTNREGLITRGISGIGRMGGEGHSETGGGVHGTLDVGRAEMGGWGRHQGYGQPTWQG